MLGPIVYDFDGARLSLDSPTRLHNTVTLGDGSFLFVSADLVFTGPLSGLLLEAQPSNPGDSVAVFGGATVDITDASLAVYSNPGYTPEDCKEFEVLTYDPGARIGEFASFGNLNVGGVALAIDYSEPDRTVLRAPGAGCL